MAVQKQHEHERQELTHPGALGQYAYRSGTLDGRLACVPPGNTVPFNEAITATSDLLRPSHWSIQGASLAITAVVLVRVCAGALGVKLALSRPARRGPGRRWLVDVLGAEFLDSRITISPIVLRRHRTISTYQDLEIQHEPLSAYAREISPWAIIYPPGFDQPDLDFVEIAHGMGVAGRRITRPEEIQSADD